MTFNLQQTIFLSFFLCELPSVFLLGLHEQFSWSRINYEWPSENTEDVIAFPNDTNDVTIRPPSNTPDRSSYIYENNIPMGANLWRNKLFITVPRRRPGVPSSLNYVWVNASRQHNAPLKPYPDWDSNTLGSGEGKIVSVYRVAIDSCDRMWFVDTGIIETPGHREEIQPSALVIMDLNTNTIIRRHIIDSSFLRPATTLASVTVDIGPKGCEDAFAYMPDLGGYSVIVYSLASNRSWRVSHNFFFLEPLAGEFSIGGLHFQWNDGIFSIALSDLEADGYRSAYFHSMAGFNQYRMSTRVLRNESAATRAYHGNDFKFVGNRGALSQASSSDLHKKRNILFLGLVNQNALACWKIKSPLKEISIVQKDDQKMIYPCDVKISDDTIILLTNNMPIFLYGKLDYNTTNFRIWVQSVDMAVRRTKCGQN